MHVWNQAPLLFSVVKRDKYWFAPRFAHGILIVGNLGAIALCFFLRRSPGTPHTGPVGSFGAHGIPNRSIRGRVRQPGLPSRSCELQPSQAIDQARGATLLRMAPSRQKSGRWKKAGRLAKRDVSCSEDGA